MRETEKIFINNKFSGYGFKRNHQERVVNRTSTNDTTNTTEIIHKLGQLEDVLEKHNIDIARDLDIEIRANRDKVYKYESIEKELDIDLITLFKALKSKTLWFLDYEKTNYGFPFEINTCDCQFYFNDNTIHIIDLDDYSFKDYGKTWALTEEELK